MSKLGIDTHGIGKSHGAVDVTICNVDDLEHNEQRTQKSNLREVSVVEISITHTVFFTIM